ncbi:MAG: hypothetical protein WKF57_05920 [Nakamurella sp.]
MTHHTPTPDSITSAGMTSTLLLNPGVTLLLGERHGERAEAGAFVDGLFLANPDCPDWLTRALGEHPDRSSGLPAL